MSNLRKLVNLSPYWSRYLKNKGPHAILKTILANLEPSTKNPGLSFDVLSTAQKVEHVITVLTTGMDRGVAVALLDKLRTDISTNG